MLIERRNRHQRQREFVVPHNGNDPVGGVGRIHVQAERGQACQVPSCVFRDRFKGQSVAFGGFALGKHQGSGDVDIALRQRTVRQGSQSPSQGAHVKHEEAKTCHAERSQG